MSPEEFEIEQRGESLRFSIRVQPRASRNQVSGLFQGALRVRLTAPPVDDRANRQLIDFMSSLLEIPRRNIQISAGYTSRLKTLELTGLSLREFQARIEKILYNQ